MTYSVRLDVFEGPLDLLLHLVSKERLDVADISISAITEEYLRVVRTLGEMDLEVASSFLILAATLLELKSLKLLPGASGEDPEVAALLEERDHLLHRLIQYSTFKRVASKVSFLLEEHRDYHSREAAIGEEFFAKAPDLLAGVSPQQIAGIALAVLAPRPAARVDVSYIAPIRVSVREMVDRLEQEVRELGVTSFHNLCRRAVGRIDVIVRFLALLELFKMEAIDLEQKSPFEEIVVRWRRPMRRDQSQ